MKTMKWLTLLCALVPSVLLSGCAPVPTNPVSLDEFNRVQPGMTVVQVEALVGAPGQEVRRDQDPRVQLTFIALNWKNPDGSVMMTSFQNGRLVVKSQRGLR